MLSYAFGEDGVDGGTSLLDIFLKLDLRSDRFVTAPYGMLGWKQRMDSKRAPTFVHPQDYYCRPTLLKDLCQFYHILFLSIGASDSSTAGHTEAELYGLSTAVCDLLAAIHVLEELGYKKNGSVPVFCDSRGARLLIADSAAPSRTRHIHRRWYLSATTRRPGPL